MPPLMWNNRGNKSWHSFFIFFYPHNPLFSSPHSLLSVVFYISVFFLEVDAALSHYVSTSCVSVVIMPVSLCLAVLFPLSLSLCFSVSFPLCRLSLSLPRRMRSFMSTTPLRRPLHISRAPGEGNVAFLRGATQTEQSLQESGKKRNKQQTNEMGSRDHVKYIGLEGQFITHCFMFCNIEYNAH